MEFKQTGGDYSPDDIAMYFTARRNEANLRGANGGWLVFAVNNKTRRVVGTDYRPQAERLLSLKMQAAENAEPRITFRDTHELGRAGGRELQFEIPAAPQNTPIARKGHYYARAGESLTLLELDKPGAGAGLDGAGGSWYHAGHAPENVRYDVVDSFGRLMEIVK